MNLAELKQAVDRAIEMAKGYLPPEEIPVSVQIDDSSGNGVFSDDVELHYDNDCQASGCVFVGDFDGLIHAR